MNGSQVRELDTKELETQAKNASEQMFRIRFQMSMGQAEGLKKYRTLRKDRARMLGALRERELAAQAELEPGTVVPVKPQPTKGGTKSSSELSAARKG